MKRIVVEKFQVTRLKEKIQFQITLPDNAIKLIGINVSTDLNMITGTLPKITHRGIGILRLHIAQADDCFFSEMLHQDFSIPNYEKTGNDYWPIDPWSEILKSYKPFPAQELSEGTVICGYYEDLVGYLKESPTAYNIILTLHYQIR